MHCLLGLFQVQTHCEVCCESRTSICCALLRYSAAGTESMITKDGGSIPEKCSTTIVGPILQAGHRRDWLSAGGSKVAYHGGQNKLMTSITNYCQRLLYGVEICQTPYTSL